MNDGSGTELATVAAPWATDAVGRAIPTHFESDGAQISQVVDLAAVTDIEYPVVADPAITVTSYEYKYVNVNKTPNWTNTSKQLGICKVHAGAGGGTCTISQNYTVNRSVDVSFGLTASNVAVGVGLGSSASVSGTVSWTSGVAPAGTTYKAWAVGTKVNFRIQKWKVVKAGGRTARTLLATSGVLSAFSPKRGFAVGR